MLWDFCEGTVQFWGHFELRFNCKHRTLDESDVENSNVIQSAPISGCPRVWVIGGYGLSEVNFGVNFSLVAPNFMGYGGLWYTRSMG